MILAGVVYVSVKRSSTPASAEPVAAPSDAAVTPETPSSEAETLRNKPPSDVMPPEERAAAPDLSLESMLVGEFTAADVRDSHRLVFTEEGQFEYWRNGERVKQSTFALSSDLRTADVGGWDRVEILGPDTLRYQRINFTRSK